MGVAVVEPSSVLNELVCGRFRFVGVLFNFSELENFSLMICSLVWLFDEEVGMVSDVLVLELTLVVVLDVATELGVEFKLERLPSVVVNNVVAVVVLLDDDMLSLELN